MDETFCARLGRDELLAAAAPLIELALAEDLDGGDPTSEAILPADGALTGQIVAKQAGVVAGLDVAARVFERVDHRLRWTAEVADGDRVAAGTRIASVCGPPRALLAAERTALNFLQRMSGVASHTRRFVDAVAGTEAVILDTRKTLPAYRMLDKYAVRLGGGHNHRLALGEMMLVKDNHVDAAGGIAAAVTRARGAFPDLPLEVEVRDLDELGALLAITPPVTRALLDNFELAAMRAAVAVTARRVPLEVSGNVSLATVAAIAATGVDMISVGALTHSAPALDLSLNLDDEVL